LPDEQLISAHDRQARGACVCRKDVSVGV
jgi:hypothetical protein